MPKTTVSSSWVHLSFFAAALLLPNLSIGGPGVSAAIKSIEADPSYPKPIATLFGSVTNSGWYQSAWVGKGFGFYIGLPVTLSYVSDKDRAYDALWYDDGCTAYKNHHTPGQPGYSNCQEVSSYQSATIFGGVTSKQLYSVYDKNYTHRIIQTDTIPISGGSDMLSKIEALPFVTPQIGLSFWYTEFKFRYLALPEGLLPLDSGQKISMSFLGVGFQHDLRSIFTTIAPISMPVDLSVVGNMSFLSIDFTPGNDIAGSMHLGGTSSFFGILLGYTYSHWLEVFMETGWESANIKTSGNLIFNANKPLAEQDPESLHMSVDGRNGLRASLNLALHFGYDIVGGQNLGANLGQHVNVLAYRHNKR